MPEGVARSHSMQATMNSCVTWEDFENSDGVVKRRYCYFFTT